MYVDVTTTIRYNLNVTPLNSESIKQEVLTAIIAFNSTYLDDFNKTLRYSNFVKAIDAADRSILSNDTIVRPIRLITPTLNADTNYDIDFAQSIENNFAALATQYPSNYISSIESTNFVTKNKIVSLEDDGNGVIRIVTLEGNNYVVVENIGSIDYNTGKVQLRKLNVTSYSGTGIKVYARTKRKDISSLLRTLLTIKAEDVRINIISERE